MTQLGTIAGRALRGFAASRRGGTAVIFALSFIPFGGLAGVMLDYVRMADLRTGLQTESDATALNVATQGPLSDDTRLLGFGRSAMQAKYGNSLTSIRVEGQWINRDDYRVVVHATYQTTLSRIVPGVPAVSTVRAEAIAKAYVPPQNLNLVSLSYDAAWHDEVYGYCYNPVTRARTQMTFMVDNRGHVGKIPICRRGETLSYRMYSAGNAEHFSDTTLDRTGREKYNFPFPQLETRLCNEPHNCMPLPPESVARTPEVAASGCKPGKYMYYGWEDIPGGGDRDYNDIRFTIKCPDLEFQIVRLIK